MSNKFGMFIHWGLYSITADHEQTIARRDISHTDYESLINQFNPVDYNPEQWVLLAKDAGMKYICLTTKHHDGFCLWDTAYSEYNIMNTPYKKDVLKELSDACQKHDMLLSLYYSNPDWHHENGYNPESTHQWKAKNKETPNTEKYREYIKNQITELLTKYGDIYTLFWDIPPKYDDPSVNELVRSLQPNILINDRGFGKGDFDTPERKVPEGNRFERMTEACESVGEQSWGYRENEDYHSLRYLMSSIDKIMAMGGNYLLNVGPMANGEIPAKSTEIIKKIGDWYNRLEGCLEGAQADKFEYGIPRTRKNSAKMIALSKNGKTYFHLYDGLPSSALILSEYPNEPKSARLLNTGENLPFELSCLPSYIDKDGTAKGPYLRIFDIPIDELVHEPIVIEVEF